MFEVAGEFGIGGTQRFQPIRARRALRQNDGKPADQIGNHAGGSLPALEGFFGDASVDQRQRNTPPVRFGNQVGPKRAQKAG